MNQSIPQTSSKKFTVVATVRRMSVAMIVVSAGVAFAGERSLIDTTKSPGAKMYMTDLADVKWNGGLWGERFEVCRDTMVPHLWNIFRDKHDSHAWDNFLMAAGLGTGRDGKPHGPSFNDGDFLKWVEALSQIYAVTRDPKIDAQMDEIIAVVAKAQREDGYLHTPKIILQRQNAAAAAKESAPATGPKPGVEPGPAIPVKAREFEDREHFETYNMGHLMTTACIHYRATGKTTLLACARKAADYIEHLCKTVPGDLARNAICPSHYMGVVELYRTTREPRYLELAKQLIEIRSLVPPEVGSDHNQDRVPFRQMTEAVGHAVRANYLYAGVADVVAENGDASLLKTLATISDDVSGQKLYVTGMTGALYDGASPDGSTKHPTIKTVHQAYGRDYQLPNLTAYNETCATVGYAMWMWRMLEVTGDARYTDLFEQSLYNGVLPGISLEGKDYFYVNPLRKTAAFDWPMRWSRTRTPNIKSSFCCPPNVIRTIAEAHNYVYSLSPDTLWVNLYAASELNTAWTDGSRIRLKQETDYPWDGAVKVTIAEAPPKAVTLKFRIPGWLHAGAATVRVNGTPLPNSPVATPGSYFEVKRAWQSGDVVTLDFQFKPVLLEANPLVEETLNQVSVKYGPLVYCLESNDLPAGVRLSDVAIALDDKNRQFALRSEKIANARVLTLSLPALQISRPAWQPGQLYREVGPAPSRAFELKLVPYYAWGNRGDTEMSVWLPVR
jgi:uncharacterized protein